MLWIAVLAFSQSADPFRVLTPKLPRTRRATAKAPLFWSNSSTVEQSNNSNNRIADRDDSILCRIDDWLLQFSSRVETTKDVDFIVKRIDAMHTADCEIAYQSPLVMEDLAATKNSSIWMRKGMPYEWIRHDDSGGGDGGAEHHPPLVVRSIVEPVLDAASTAAVRQAADDYWNAASCGGGKAHKSRFTYQYPGNSEVHLSDLLYSSSHGAKSTKNGLGKKAVDAVNQALTDMIYPMIREAFLGKDASQLFVYDALVIRYNATAAAKQIAGQPLHRDLGLVSVNIMLNDDFEGGGTFFENQLRSSSLWSDKDSVPKPMKPVGVGHCLAHAAAERHAGAGTVSGVREILILFVTAVHSAKIQNARLKQCRSECEKSCSTKLNALWCRIRHQRLAVAADPHDGEAYQYLGTALMNYAEYVAQPEQQATSNVITSETALQAAVACFERAAVLTPCDSRVYNNFGIALGRQQRLLEAEEAYRRGLVILIQSEVAGCNVGHDMDLISLNYGLDLANQDRFAEACEILARPASKRNDGVSNSRTIEDAYRLRKFCESSVEGTAA